MSRMILKPGSRDKSVILAKKRLIKWLNRHGHNRLARLINPKSTVYGPAMKRGVLLFQRAKGLKADGVIGPATWKKLNPPLRKRIRRLSKRQKMLKWMNWSLHNEASIHYKQYRPMPLGKMKRMELPFTSDCSGTITGCHYYAGAKDPNGRSYNGTGYTGTMRANTARIALKDAKPGDFIIYGGGTGAHTVMVYNPHPTDPTCWSHGQENGPRLYKHSMYVSIHRTFTVHRAKV